VLDLHSRLSQPVLPCEGGAVSDPQPQPEPLQASGCTAYCPECGEVIEVHDIVGLLRALHAVNECSVRSLLRQQD
jgi:hypothetical protein